MTNNARENAEGDGSAVARFEALGEERHHPVQRRMGRMAGLVLSSGSTQKQGSTGDQRQAEDYRGDNDAAIGRAAVTVA